MFPVADIHSNPKDFKGDAHCAMIYYSLALLHGLNSYCLPLIFARAQNKSPVRNLVGLSETAEMSEGKQIHIHSAHF